MKRQKNTEPFLPIDGLFGKEKVLISHIKSITSIKKRSLIKNLNGIENGCSLPLSKIDCKFRKHGLLKIKQDKVVNLNHLLEVALLEGEKFNFGIIKLIGGEIHKVAKLLQRKLKRVFKKYQLKCWRDLLTLILWELLEENELGFL